MIDRVIDWSCRHSVLLLAIVAGLTLAGWWSATHVALDALPDLSDTQVIVYAGWDRSPELVENQVTYPLVTALVGAPGVKAVRGFSDFGFSHIYVVFEDGIDVYWARSRTLEYLSAALPALPQGVKPEIGPDANGLGWVFQYVLVDDSRRHTLADLRSVQDFYLRYHLRSVAGVAEVASLGGYRRQYQINLDPDRLRAFGIPVRRVVDAVRGGNQEAAGRLIEFGGTEYMIRGRGWAQSLADLADIALAAGEGGTPIRVKDVGEVIEGPDIRRGVSDLDGTGDAVSGIVIMRQGQNALEVIDAVQAKLRAIAPGLPEGVRVVPVYDRSRLIRSAIDNLRTTLVEVIVTVSLVILLFLWHVPSALVPVITIPVAVLISFIPFRLLGINANIMSLGGLAIAIGAMVDASIVMVEHAYKKLEAWKRSGEVEDPCRVVIDAVRQVARPSFFALLVIAVSFLPVLTLEAQEGRLFKPLAYTKSLSMGVAAVLAVTLGPVLRLMFTRSQRFTAGPEWLRRAGSAAFLGRFQTENRHPVIRVLIRFYQPLAIWSLRHPAPVIAAAAALLMATVPVFAALGSELMPPLHEGTLLYMPSTLPGISVSQAQTVLQVSDRIIRQFPEVDRVFGKAGRADTATDPAPLSMLETVVTLKPVSEWRRVRTWYSDWAPEWAKSAFRHVTPDRISPETLVTQMNAALTIPGVSNAWTMPVRGRIEMLSSGMRTIAGLKVHGPDALRLGDIGARVESLLRQVPGARSVFAERAAEGHFLDITWNRQALSRHGLSIEDAQSAVEYAIGGETVTTIVDGRAQYPVNVRFLRDFRSDPGALGRIPIATPDGQRHIPLAELADIGTATGPSMIRDENGLLTGYVYIDLAGRDPASFMVDADRALKADAQLLPAGFSMEWSGQYEAMERVRRRLKLVVPLTLLLMCSLLYMNTRAITKTLIILLAVPFSAIGAVWFLFLLGYHMSLGVWVGVIALMGVDAETGAFMLLYLDLAYEQAAREGRLRGLADLQQVILEGAVQRMRPKFMTASTMMLGLVPILWSVGTGADVMKRIAAPMIGGIVTSFLLELVVYPAVYQIWRWDFGLKRLLAPGLVAQ